MLKFTFHADVGVRKPECYINPEHVIMVHAANPSGAIIELARTRVHVAQSADQVVDMLKNYYGEK